ncbi:LysR family transcriptional regulator [Vibrio lentus]|uniref:LysR family transcriptional regulator n=1 Tax=Vibrio lentus TaxID=136468 RepID=UPI000C8655C6|nr:LysR family transcriptional regulator [Vibrio lentus]PMJ63971.1 LysR family transcriptional regulator [Vibrio lentus]PMM53227.1 LysR family transcriptional regulator [Vibrio lentus]
MKSLNLNLLVTFYTVVKYNSFSMAADELVLSKSVVSKQIKQLENELQCTLIHRTTRTLSLTEQGEFLYQKYVKIIDDIKDCHDALDQQNETLSGTLKIRLPIVLEHDHELMAKISQFMIQHPHLELELTYGYTLSGLLNEGIDLAFHIGAVPDSTYKCRKIKDIGTQVVASPSYVREFGEPQVPSDLKQHRCMNYRSCLTKDKWRFNYSDNSHEFVELKSTIRSDSEAMLVEMAKNGVGVSCALDFLVRDYIAKGALVSLLQSYTWSTELYIVYPSTVVPPYKVRTFIDHLLAE